MSSSPFRYRGWPVWAALVLVVGVALGLGSTGGGAPATAAQRASAIDARVLCPSCAGISVLDSSAVAAVAIRQAVLTRVRAGQSDGQIESFLVSRYGQGILLSPPTHGSTAWVWVLPPAAVLVAVAGLSTVLLRRRHRTPAPVSAEDRALVRQALAERSRGVGRPPGTVPAP